MHNLRRPIQIWERASRLGAAVADAPWGYEADLVPADATLVSVLGTPSGHAPDALPAWVIQIAELSYDGPVDTEAVRSWLRGELSGSEHGTGRLATFAVCALPTAERRALVAELDARPPAQWAALREFEAAPSPHNLPSQLARLVGVTLGTGRSTKLYRTLAEHAR